MAAAPPIEAGCAAALVSLAGMGPRRLALLLEGRSAEEAWAEVRAGRAAPRVAPAVQGSSDPRQLAARWASAAATVHPAALARRCAELGVHVALHGRPGYPALLDDDVEPSPVLFWTGPLDELAGRPRAAVVGMRNATRYGLSVARRLGSDLAGEDVVVVSGLAAGIDAAAHHGATGTAGGAPVVAVVASGHDVVYPRANARLWARVAERGVVVSEVPPGGRPEAWRFPARNRIIAALGQAVVVVESGARGGSLYTVEEAQRRDRPVLAVPGPVDSPASAGTNALLADGALVARDVDDVLVAIGHLRRPGRARTTAGRAAAPALDPAAAAVLGELVGRARTLGELAAGTGLGLAQLAAAVQRLRDAGRVAQSGAWIERVPEGAGPAVGS